MIRDLASYVREAFGWDEDVAVSAGPSGARRQIWRLDVGPARYAIKEMFAEPPSQALIEAEFAFARRAAEAGSTPTDPASSSSSWTATASSARSCSADKQPW